ncbi:MAG: hypothetical protein H7062_08025 [Candidatus Saccharimonas sp.]|nr:hypothetical protein [Planctomycetaceae bacterium]
MRALPAVRIGFVVLAAFGLSLVVSLALTVRADDDGMRERVIVMNSGRILTGQMTRNAGGWLVEQASGRVQVPEDQVKLVADNLRDAYRRQRDAIVEPTPATHIMLAQWCISYRLHDEARDELKKCLKRDPDHDEARKLLRRIDDSLTVKPVAGPAPLLPWKTPDGFVMPEVESLGGLSKEAATAFTTRVQPLLMNKCGNAACHGAAARGEFKLHSIRMGSNGHRIYTERNLAEILRYVDVKDPALSPLIAVPQGSHGGTTAIFHGPQSAEQLKTLRTFVKTVAKEKQIEERELAQRPSVLDKKKPSPREVDSATTAASEPSQRDSAVTPVAASTTAARQRVATANRVKDDSPQTLPDDDTAIPLDEDSNDAFDPNVFNRRFHGAKKTHK